MKLRELHIGAVGKRGWIDMGDGGIVRGQIKDLRVTTVEECNIGQRQGEGDVYIDGYGITIGKWKSDQLTGEENVGLVPGQP